VLNLELQVRSYTDREVRAIADRLVERVSAIPGVESAAATDFLPLNMGNQETVVSVEGREQRPGVGRFQTDYTAVTPEYFGTLTLPLAEGRAFRASDRDGSAQVAIVNEALAHRLWPGESAVGKQLRIGGEDAAPSEIVGVARDARYRSIGDPAIPMVYVAFAQQGGRSFSLLVRSRPGAASPAGALRALVREIDPALPIASNTPYLAIIGLSLIPNRVALGLALLFGGTGLVLAAVGLYGVLSYTVSRRRREIGIRMALGAASRDVRNMILGDGLRLTAIGLFLGFGVAALVSRLLRSFLFGVSPLDPLTYGAIAVILGTVALTACLMPTRRALSTEPLEVLRHD